MMRRMLALLVLVVVGSGLLYLGNTIRPSVGDKSITLSEFSSRSRLSVGPTVFGEVCIVLAVLMVVSPKLAAYTARQRKQRRELANEQRHALAQAKVHAGNELGHEEDGLKVEQRVE